MTPLHKIALLVLVLAPLVTALMISDIFDVYMEDAPGSCKDFYGPHDNKNPIDRWWTQSNELNERAYHAIQSYEGSEDQGTRFAARSMFGIMWQENQEQPDWKKPAEKPDYERLVEVEYRLQKMEQFMKTPQRSPLRPKIFCDTTYRTLQKPGMPFIDIKTGKKQPKIPNRRNGPFVTIDEKHDVDLENQWWFYYDVPDGRGARERAYDYQQKDSLDDHSPYPIDPESGQPSECLTHSGGITFIPPAGSGRSIHLILCMDKLLKEHWKFDDLPTSMPGTDELAEVQPKSLLLYHELWHVVFQHEAPDLPMLVCKATKPSPPHYPPDWPIVGSKEGKAPHFYKWPQDRRAWAYSPDMLAYGPLLSSHVALFDRSRGGEPATSDPRFALAGEMAIHAPENYVWFAMQVWMSAHTEYDWPSGAARKKNDEYEGAEDRVPWVPSFEENLRLFSAADDAKSRT